MDNNKKILTMLEELRDIMQRRGDAIRAKAYENASTQIMLLKKDIINPKIDLKEVIGIGKTITDKIDTYLKTGTLEILEREKNNPINIFTQVYGIGPKKAEELVKKEITTIEQLKNNLNLLNDKQKIGVKYYDDILKCIPRSEIDDFYVKLSIIFEMFDNSDNHFEIVGSYRREKQDSGDIDIIITNSKNDKSIFNELLDYLKQEKYIIEDGFLSRGDVKSLTIIDIYPEKENTIKRRVDFLYAPPNQYAFAILYFTGSKIFNTVMRQRAKDMGYTLNEHEFCYYNNGIKGKKVEKEFPDEKSIFDFLQIKFKRPNERIDALSVEDIDFKESNNTNKHNKTLKKLKIVKVDYIEKFKNEGISSLDLMTKDELLNMIKELNYSYYIESSDSILVNDNEYDIIKEYIEKKYPDVNPNTLNHSSCQIKQIEKNKVILPYELWSMDKIKPTSDAVNKWTKKYKGPYLISCKLDGISALYVSNKNSKEAKLYTRGNGKEGQDISHLINAIIWKNQIPYNFEIEFVLRGEIIIKREIFEKKYKDKFANPRNFVAGLVNKKTIDNDILIDLDFVPYEVIEPKKIPSEQMLLIQNKWLRDPVRYIISETIDNEKLSEKLLEWRENYDYEIDGLVIVDNNIYERPNKNPEYAFAFKMIISEQIAEAKVLEVIWTPSKDGYLKPRIKIDKIELGGVTIEYATGFNAKFIIDNNIGVGALITIMRSGDVIPHIMNVVEPAQNPMMPNYEYIWNESGVDIIVKDKENDDIVKQKNIAGFFKILDIAGIGMGNIKRIIDSGYDSVPKILAMKKDDFLKVEGFKEKMANNLYTSIQNKLEKVTITELMTASNIFGRGFREKRFKSILEIYPDILDNESKYNEKVNMIKDIDGIALKTAERFVNNIDKFNEFLKEANLKNIKYSNNKNIEINTNNVLFGKKIVMTGFRDKELIENIKSFGAEVVDSVTKNTFIVLAKDINEDTTKANTARLNNIQIMTPHEFKEKYLT